ncbi:MAG: bifunctional phosphoribosylaminoimidazolecarboxamide formyltransferase/IMP cyclohydrolase [Pirellulales bacterium]
MAAVSHAALPFVAPDHVPLRRALLSVSDKAGLERLAPALAAAGVELLSTGGTLKWLNDHGHAARDVAEYTGFPEMLDGRVKTLHPKIHGGILALRDVPTHAASMTEYGIQPIDLVVVNLYPFEETVAKPNIDDATAIENIDIGGPSLIRGAAKNHAYVAVLTSPEQYDQLIASFKQNGGTSLELRRKLAGDAYSATGRYDTAIAAYFAKPKSSTHDALHPTPELFPQARTLHIERVETLRYGENPHQAAALYASSPRKANSVVAAKQLHGKELSYNNWLDLDACWGIVRMLPDPSAVVIKHNNPCGAASHAELSAAMRRAWDGDPVSAFGSVLGLNRSMDAATAEVLAEPDRFVEAIIAPSFTPEAFEILTTKPKWKANVRLVEIGSAAPVAPQILLAEPVLRQIDGGWLVQNADVDADQHDHWRVVTKTQPDAAIEADLRFAWAMVRHVKSNAILLAKDRMVLGVGAGQMSRVDSVEISIRKAGERARGAVLASDAFFPFADSIGLAVAAGVRAIIQPGGSKRDDEVVAACDAAGLPMIFTGRRHFKH